MLNWLKEIRKWLFAIGMIIILIFLLRQCTSRRKVPATDAHKETVEEAKKEGFEVDEEVKEVSTRKLEKETGITGKALETVTTAKFESPVTEVEVVVDTAGQVFVRGRGEGDTTLIPVKVITIKRKPRGKFVRMDLGIRLGVGWDLGNTIQYGGKIQIFSFFNNKVTAPDILFTNEYAGVGIGFPISSWWKGSPLKNTVIGGGTAWDYSRFGGYPKAVLTISVRL